MGYYAKPEDINRDVYNLYSYLKEFAINHFSFIGERKVNGERSLAKKDCELTLAFEAKDVYLVMRSDTKKDMRVFLDKKIY